MDYSIKVQTLLQIEKKKWIFLVGLVALTHLFCQTLMLPYGTALLSLLPDGKDKENSVVDVSVSNSNKESVFVSGMRSTSSHNVGGIIDDHDGKIEKDKEEKVDFSLEVEDMDNDFHFVEDEILDSVDIDLKDEFMMENERSQENGVKNAISNTATVSTSLISPANPLLIKSVLEKRTKSEESSSAGSLQANNPVKKKMRCDMPPKTVMPINEMEKLLVRNRARSRAMRPRWSSERDQEIMKAKLQIESAPILKNDRDLYAPLFRNISMFKRSYELMERLLKIYVYKEGEKPIFHQPVLKGLYASEGWFMKLMEGNKQFVVKDPRKAHLFYMPFSSRMLEHTLYVRNSHNRTNLRQYLKDYSEKIAAKYRFWNRTGGADHFLVACHDWAPYETRHHMEHCMKALCNADVTMGFKIGRDVSLPETYVRSARNPLRDLGGKPPSQRNILSFYAGSMHGYLRPILLKHWKDKSPDMKILERMPLGVASKMNYIDHMKSSKYCICPKGYEVNSPRIVEAIFYECVPVIISDNFVPPFFEVLNWDAFSVVLAEKDVPNLRNILVSIPEQKYLDLQIGVRKVQRHFLWHAKPVSCNDLAKMLMTKMTNQNEKSWFKLHPSCTLEAVHALIQQNSTEKLRRKLNGGLVDHMLNNARENLDFRLNFDSEMEELVTITLQALEAGVKVLSERVKVE